jgi:hypothetical protein
MRRKHSQRQPTEHACLVVWGDFARQSGFLEGFQRLTFHQRTRQHTPGGKVLELLLATLAGLPYLQDISRAAHPLDQDLAVAQAWEQAGWADYSGVSRTLQKISLAEAQAVIAYLQSFSQPFFDREVALALQAEGQVILDGDLTGIPVSKSSRSYPNAAFGHMDDAIRLGYQAAVVSLQSPSYQRIWLSIDHKPGNTLSSSQAEALVQAAEARLNRRPWRRTDLLEKHVAQLSQITQAAQQKVEYAQALLERARLRLETIRTQQVAVIQQAQQLKQVYAESDRPLRPKSKLALAQERVAVLARRIPRNEQTLEKAQRRLGKAQTNLDRQEALQQQAQERLERFQQDNRCNPDPLPMVIRLDAGFGTWENLGLLIEMGYEVYSKAFSAQTVQVLFQQFGVTSQWEQVGERVHMHAHAQGVPVKFWYPLDIGLLRIRSDDRLKKGSLLHFGSASVSQDLPSWFHFYNHRQGIEAGIKESKQVFCLHHLKVRSEPAILVQENFVLFAGNFIRWASAWVSGHAQGSAKQALSLSRLGMKRLVQAGAHTSATVNWNSEGCLLRFNDLSFLAGKHLWLPRNSLKNKGPSQKSSFFRSFWRFFV